MTRHKQRNYTRLSPAVLKRLERVYNRALPFELAEGLNWYKVAHEVASALATRYHVPLNAVCGAIACLSPGSQWDRNLEDVGALLDAWAGKSAIPVLGVYGRRNTEKALACLNGTDPLSVLNVVTGPKTHAFYLCLLNPTGVNGVCIDRHALAAALDVRGVRGGSEDAKGLTGARYRFYAWHYEVLAARVGVLPHEAQAVVWVTWKRATADYSQELPF